MTDATTPLATPVSPIVSSFAAGRHWVGVAATLMLAVLAGCATGGGSLVDIRDEADFDARVVQAKGPVLVEFYKDGCPTCVLQEATMEELAPEYSGKVVFARFKIRHAYMASSAPKIMDRYELFWVPTMILFVDGKPVNRWVFNHGASELRGPLNEAISGRPKPAKATKPLKPAVEGLSPTGLSAQKCVEGQGCPVR